MPHGRPALSRMVGTLVAIVLAVSISAPAIAQRGAESPAEVITGEDLMPGGIDAVRLWRYLPDAKDDFETQAGARHTGIGAGSDAAGVYVGTGKLNGKAVKQIKKIMRRPDAFNGSSAKFGKKDEVIVIVIPMHGPIDWAEQADLQVWIGLDGKKPLAAAPGTATDFFTGNQSVSMGGKFKLEDGVNYFSGSTNLKGLQPGERPAVFGAKDRTVGFYSKDLNALVVIIPRSKDATSARITVVTSQEDMFLMDPLGASNDGPRISLDPSFEPGGLLCYTLKAEPVGDDLMRVEATAAFSSEAFEDIPYSEDNARAAALSLFGRPMKPDDASANIFDPRTSTFVVADAANDGETADGSVTILTASAEMTPGTYEFDHFPFYERYNESGIRPGTYVLDPKRSGIVFGKPNCGRWRTPGPACDHVDIREIADVMGVPAEGATGRSLTADDGSELCTMYADGAADPFAVLGIEVELFDEDEHLDPPFAPTCEKHAEHGTGGMGILSCGDGDITSLVTQVAPQPLVEPPVDPQKAAAQRIWIDALHAHGANEDTILGEEMYEKVKETAEEIGRLTGIDVGLRFQ